jgi:Cyclic nucleotide-binding domain
VDRFAVTAPRAACTVSPARGAANLDHFGRTLRFDGTTFSRLEGARSLPRHWVYDSDGRQPEGCTHRLGGRSQQSWTMTPWEIMITARHTVAETGLERLIATAIMRDHTRSQIRRLGKGTVLMQKGRRAVNSFYFSTVLSLYRLNGKDLAELGPGAIMGERAILEGGKRTSTLTAVTPIRVAVAPNSAIDVTALGRLSHRHHLEDDPNPHRPMTDIASYVWPMPKRKGRWSPPRPEPDLVPAREQLAR